MKKFMTIFTMFCVLLSQAVMGSCCTSDTIRKQPNSAVLERVASVVSALSLPTVSPSSNAGWFTAQIPDGTGSLVMQLPQQCEQAVSEDVQRKQDRFDHVHTILQARRYVIDLATVDVIALLCGCDDLTIKDTDFETNIERACIQYRKYLFDQAMSLDQCLNNIQAVINEKIAIEKLRVPIVFAHYERELKDNVNQDELMGDDLLQERELCWKFDQLPCYVLASLASMSAECTQVYLKSRGFTVEDKNVMQLQRFVKPQLRHFELKKVKKKL